MFQFKKPKTLCSVCHMRKFCLPTDASCDMWCLLMLNMQLPCVSAERTIHHGLVMDGQSCGQNQ